MGHLHYWSVQMTRNASKDEVLDAFRNESIGRTNAALGIDASLM